MYTESLWPSLSLPPINLWSLPASWKNTEPLILAAQPSPSLTQKEGKHPRVEEILAQRS